MSANPITDQWTAGAGIYGRFKARFACLPVRLLVNLGLTAPSLFFFIMTRTKSTLGRVWARYYNWYGMTGKLRTALLQHGWTEEWINNYDQANHLTVNSDHEGENPDAPAPNNYAWLRRHQPLPLPAKQPRSQLWAKSLRKTGTDQPAGGKKKPRRYRPGKGLVQSPSKRFAGTKSQQSY